MKHRLSVLHASSSNSYAYSSWISHVGCVHVMHDAACPMQALCTQIPGVANLAHIDNSELPLSYAARQNCAEAARALVEYGGAQLEAKDVMTGKTALKVCWLRGLRTCTHNWTAWQ